MDRNKTAIHHFALTTKASEKWKLKTRVAGVIVHDLGLALTYVDNLRSHTELPNTGCLHGGAGSSRNPTAIRLNRQLTSYLQDRTRDHYKLIMVKIPQTVNPQPATRQPTTCQPATRQPATCQPATRQPATHNPSPRNPSPSKPSTSKPSPSKPSTSNPSPSNPSPSNPSPSKPSPSKPSPSKPSPSKPSPSKLSPSNPQPVNQQPVTQQPVAQQTVAQQPFTQQPVNQQPVTQQTTTRQPATNNPQFVNQQPINQQHVNQQPTTLTNEVIDNLDLVTSDRWVVVALEATEGWQIAIISDIDSELVVEDLVHAMTLEELQALVLKVVEKQAAVLFDILDVGVQGTVLRMLQTCAINFLEKANMSSINQTLSTNNDICRGVTSASPKSSVWGKQGQMAHYRPCLRNGGVKEQQVE
ncbi:hypothetical protein Bbelb_018610 [Branchiostoma belcheri]|nr:hypothetical protein Bbelb_018610 [Branchiostoma belcheri]